MTEARIVKATGRHYTPAALAAFLVRRALDRFDPGPTPSILDPSCGEGELLLAAARAGVAGARLVGIDRDAVAIGRAGDRLRAAGIVHAELRAGDFLAGPLEDERFDLVVANPPYVRTQVLGRAESTRLRRDLGLLGRVDLYHAFLVTMARRLRPGGRVAFISSNRFLTTQAGAAVRRLLREELEVIEVTDLGDTRPFRAAVLPAVVVAARPTGSRRAAPRFTRVYAATPGAAREDATAWLLERLEQMPSGSTEALGTRYTITRGEIEWRATSAEAPWMLADRVQRDWIEGVDRRSAARFGDAARVRVGVKSTADAVFVRDDWGVLAEELRPEPECLRPLYTHEEAAPYRALAPPRRQVLYPHERRDGVRGPIDLSRFPRARAYLESHRERLEARHYVLEANRRFYELWVPHDPDAWRRPKVVFPDISDRPRFFLDESGAVVQGDCYWITADGAGARRTLLLILAVANSSLATRYYDLACGNRLYAGRRRFITQYVKRFPLPPPGRGADAIVALVESRLAASGEDPANLELEREIDARVAAVLGA